MKKFLNAALAALCLWSAHAAQALNILQLNQIPMIRVEMPKTAGLGHQSVAIHFIKRVRQLGYIGKIQLVMGTSSLPALKSLIPDQIPEASPKAIQSHIVSLNAELLVSPSLEFNPRDFNLETVELSVIAATDRDFKPSELLSQRSIVIQPTEWIGKDPRIVTEDGSEIKLPDLWKVGFENYPTPIGNPHDFIDTHLQNEISPQKAKNLKAILDPNHDLLMSYDNMNYGSRLENVITGLNQAIEKKPELFAKPIIIASLTDNPGENKLQYDFKKKFPKMKIISRNDPEASEKIAMLNPGEIAYIHVGNLPQDLFHYALTQGSLPALVTGSNATTLMKKTGQLFFSTSKHAEALPQTQSKENASFYGSLGEWTHAGIPIQDVEKVILESRNPESSVQRDYKDNADLLRKTGDRVDELLKNYLHVRTISRVNDPSCKSRL